MSTLKTRHYSKKTIAYKDVDCNKIQHLKALFVLYVIFSFSFMKRKMLHVFSMPSAGYLKFSFIVVKNKRNLNLDFS